MINIEELSIGDIQQSYYEKKISVKEIVEEYLNRIRLIDQGDIKLNSILEINPDALTIASYLDEHREEYDSNLFGIPILLKDNIDTKDNMHTSAGALALADSYAAEDADIVKILRQKGAIILGKTNMTEFANYMTKGMKPGYSSRGGLVKSPYNESKSPSGSSTGSAVAVTANLCTASIGTDTAGSITSPSKSNGIVGFRPSMGALSQKGLIPVSFTLDTAGPMTKTVKDAAIIYGELTNYFVDIPSGKTDLSRLNIGIAMDNIENVTSEQGKKIEAILSILKKSGANIKKVKIPVVSKEYLKSIQRYEFKYSIHQYLSTLPKDYPIRSLAQIIEYNQMHPTETLKYGQSLLVDALENTRGDLSELEYRVLLEDRILKKKHVLKILRDIDLCLLFQENLILQYTGLPCITIPRGLLNDGMPYGIYLTGKEDVSLLQNAYVVEQAIGRRVPPKLLT
ncbi:MAG: amidase [Lachnospiraceae bacterium]|jgi:amidase|nr:amidase [Lachnospiraceae bacterium]